MSEEKAKWYKRRADRLLQNITRLDTLISLYKNDSSQKVTKKDVAGVQTWVKVCLEDIREIYELHQNLDRNLSWNTQFHAVLTDRIDKLRGNTEAELSSLKTTIDKRDEETANTLQLILKWKRQSQRTLDRAKEYFNGLTQR